jgi:arylformamidase
VHVADHPDNSAFRRKRLEAALKEAEIPVTVFGGKETNHSKINANLGLEGDPATKALTEFVAKVLKP